MTYGNGRGRKVSGEAMNVLNELRKQIDRSGMRDVELSRKAGIQRSAISRFGHGERGLSIGSVEKILDALDLELTIVPRRRPGRKKRRAR